MKTQVAVKRVCLTKPRLTSSVARARIVLFVVSLSEITKSALLVILGIFAELENENTIYVIEDTLTNQLFVDTDN